MMELIQVMKLTYLIKEVNSKPIFIKNKLKELMERRWIHVLRKMLQTIESLQIGKRKMYN